LRIAGRSLARRPAFTLTVALTLAAGISVTTTMFSVVDIANIAGLMLADLQRRARELAIRQAIGDPERRSWRR